MIFHSNPQRCRNLTLVIRPAGHQVIDGMRVFRPAIRAEFKSCVFDTEAVDWDPDPAENKRIREMVERALTTEARFLRYYGKDYWRADDNKARQQAMEHNKSFQCPMCEFVGKNDISLEMHFRKVHAKQVEQMAEQAAQGVVAQAAAQQRAIATT